MAHKGTAKNIRSGKVGKIRIPTTLAGNKKPK